MIGARARAVIVRAKLRDSAFCVLFEEFYRVADGEDGLGGIVWNFAAEFFLECHDEFDRVETVGPEIIDEACVLGHFVGLDAQMFHDNLFNPLADVTHRCTLVSFSIELDRSAPPSRLQSACRTILKYPADHYKSRTHPGYRSNPAEFPPAK